MLISVTFLDYKGPPPHSDARITTTTATGYIHVVPSDWLIVNEESPDLSPAQGCI